MTRSNKKRAISDLIPPLTSNKSLISADVRIEGEERADGPRRHTTSSRASSRFCAPAPSSSWELAETRAASKAIKDSQKELKMAYVEVNNELGKKKMSEKKVKEEAKEKAEMDKNGDTEVPINPKAPKKWYAYHTEMPEGLTYNEQQMFMAGLPMFTEDGIECPSRANSGMKQSKDLPGMFTLKMKKHPIKGHLIKYYERKPKPCCKTRGGPAADII